MRSSKTGFVPPPRRGRRPRFRPAPASPGRTGFASSRSPRSGPPARWLGSRSRQRPSGPPRIPPSTDRGTIARSPAMISIAEGCALAVLFAASHPDLVRALVLITPTPRVVRGPDYEWAQTTEERAATGCGRDRAVPDRCTTTGAQRPRSGDRPLYRHRRVNRSRSPAGSARRLAMSCSRMTT